MPVQDKATVADAVGEQIDLAQLPGFHVVRKDDGLHLGTYPTQVDAEAYIEGHLLPQKIKADIVEGAND